MSARPAEPRRSRRPSTVVRRALRSFAVWSVVTLLALTAGVVLLAQVSARDIAQREARVRTAGFARNVVGPLVDTALRRSPAQAGDDLDLVMRHRLGDGSVVHMVLWDADGTVLWADQPAPVGRRYPLDGDARALLTTVGVRATYARDEESPVFRPADGQLLEVSASALGADGRPVVLEWYWSTSGLRAAQTAVVERVLPLAIGGLLFFQVAVLPLALSMARGVDHARLDQAAAAERARAAVERERRRITQELHDGVVQDLTGIGYVLPSLAAAAGPDAGVVSEIARVVQRDVAALRTLVTESYPPDLGGEGFADALEQLAQSARASGVRVAVTTSGRLPDVPGGARVVAYQVVREGLRNVVKHAGAVHAYVRAGVARGELQVSVVDDGVGPGDGVAPPGHVGLRVLSDSVAGVGGDLFFGPRVGAGTVLRASLPLVR